MELTSLTLATHSVPGHDHLVEFYDTEAFLTDTVCAFLGPALNDGDVAVVVATAAHRQAFETALGAAGIDLDAARREGRYIVWEAADLLGQIMVAGRPDPTRFADTIGPVIDRAKRGERQIRIYGEAVAQLCSDGDLTSALALEELWNDLASDRPFMLLCAYPMSAFGDDASSASFTCICEQHTSVIPSESYSLMVGPTEQSRAIAQLQQQAAALHPEVLRLRAQQQILSELAYVDSLTGLGNRRVFDQQLEREWALTRRHPIDSFVVIADLDGFKALNDSRGHAAGDQVLRQFSEVLRTTARDTDVIARIGGDEFGVLLTHCNERAALSFKARLRHALAEQQWPANATIGTSLGHASLREATSPANAHDRADLAMLSSKRRTRFR